MINTIGLPFQKFYRFLKFIFIDLFVEGRFFRYIKRASIENYDLVPSYNEEGLIIYGRNCSFLKDESFIKAYDRGIKAANNDFNIRYRVYVLLWSAKMASNLNGDFIECGVARGFVSSAIMHYIQWNSQKNKRYFLLDTFEGIDEKTLTDEEKKVIGDVKVYNENSAETVYTKSYEDVVRNFEEWQNIELVKGSIPSTLSQVKTESVAFLHIDMNCVTPEIEALNYFWPKVVPGGVVVFDDYAFVGHCLQKTALDQCAKEKNVHILTLPTGQGLIIKN